jgi:hypothetical protein
MWVAISKQQKININAVQTQCHVRNVNTKKGVLDNIDYWCMEDQISNKTTFKYKLELFYTSEKIWSLTFFAEYIIESGAKHHSDNHQDRTWISNAICHDLLFCQLKWDVNVCFVDIGRIVDITIKVWRIITLDRIEQCCLLTCITCSQRQFVTLKEL